MRVPEGAHRHWLGGDRMDLLPLQDLLFIPRVWACHPLGELHAPEPPAVP